MKNLNNRKWRAALLCLTMMLWICCAAVSAGSLSSDNSLSSLGITTEGAEVSPEFYYSTIEYYVTVPAGTQSLSLDPVTSNSNAVITDISGTGLVDGETTVTISVSAEDGTACVYYLYVSEDTSTAAAVTEETQTESETEAQTEEETEEETEDPRYVRVARESLEEADNTISTLKTEMSSYRDRVSLLMTILYVMIAICVVLLFMVINLLLKRRDLSAELRTYRGAGGKGASKQQAEGSSKRAKKAAKKARKKKNSGSSGRGTEEQSDALEDPYGRSLYTEEDAYGRGGRSAYEEDNYGQNGRGAYGNRDTYNQNSRSAYGNEDTYNQNGRSAYENEDTYNRNGRSAYGNENAYGESGRGTYANESVGSQSGRDAYAQPDANSRNSNRTGKGSGSASAKPSKAKSKSKKMPEYEPLKENAPEGSSAEKKSEKVEVTMIDL